MAGDWIKVENVTPDKPEVFRIAEALGVDPDAVVGKLVRVWVWADQQTYDGHARTVTKALLDRVSGVTGFADAMILSGWLVEENGLLSFPHFDRHNGESAKTRALAGKRQKKRRSKVSRAHRDKSVTREEKRREEIDSTNVESRSGSKGPSEADIRLVFGHYRTYHPKAHRTPKATSKEWRLIKARLEEGCTVDDLKAAIDGCHRSPFHLGENDRGKKYDSLELIVRDGSKIQQFMEIPAKGSMKHERPESVTGRIHTPGYQVPDRKFKPPGTPPGRNVPTQPGETLAANPADD